MGSADIKTNDHQVRAAFLTGLTDMGNELLCFYPNIQLSDSINHDLCLKSMPMACEDGDMVITIIGEYQAICVTRIIPCFEENSFKDSTYAALGLLVPKGVNPVPYYNLLDKILKKSEAENILNKQTLMQIVPKLYHKINQKLHLQ